MEQKFLYSRYNMFVSSFNRDNEQLTEKVIIAVPDVVVTNAFRVHLRQKFYSLQIVFWFPSDCIRIQLFSVIQILQVLFLKL